MGRHDEGVVTMSEPDFSAYLGGTDTVPVEELARRQGVRPAASLDDLRADLWDSDQELDAFLADVRESRRADLA